MSQLSADGDRRDVGATDALAVARDAEPTTPAGVAPGEPNGLTAGTEVTVTPEDYAFDRVAGTLVGATADEVAIRRNDPAVSSVVVQFARFGFRVALAS